MRRRKIKAKILKSERLTPAKISCVSTRIRSQPASDLDLRARSGPPLPILRSYAELRFFAISYPQLQRSSASSAKRALAVCWHWCLPEAVVVKNSLHCADISASDRLDRVLNKNSRMAVACAALS